MHKPPQSGNEQEQVVGLSKKLFRLSLRLTVTIILLVLIFRKIGWEALSNPIRTAQWEFLIGACAIELLSSWLNAIKLRSLLGKLGCEIQTIKVFSASTISSLYSMFLPGFLSTGAKWYLLKKDSGMGTAVLTGMLYNQLSVTVVMLMFGLIALIVSNPVTAISGDVTTRWLFSGSCIILLVVICTCTVLGLSRHVGGRFLNFLRLRLNWLPQRFHHRWHRFLDLIETFQQVGWKFHLAIALFTVVASVVCGAVKYRFAAEAVDIHVSVYVLMWLYTLIYTLSRIPITLANLGVREITLIGLLHLYEVDQPHALLMSMILFSTNIFMAIVGSLYLMFGSLSKQNAE